MSKLEIGVVESSWINQARGKGFDFYLIQLGFGGYSLDWGEIDSWFIGFGWLIVENVQKS